MDGSTLALTFFQIIDLTYTEKYMPFSIVINVINDKLKLNDFECKLDESWHLLVVYFEHKKKIAISNKEYHQVKIFIDSMTKPT